MRLKQLAHEGQVSYHYKLIKSGKHLYNAAIGGAALSGMLLLGAQQTHAATATKLAEANSGSGTISTSDTSTTTASTSYSSAKTSTASAVNSVATSAAVTSAATSTANAVITPQYSTATATSTAASTAGENYATASQATSQETSTVVSAGSTATTSTASKATSQAQTAVAGMNVTSNAASNATSQAVSTTSDSVASAATSTATSTAAQIVEAPSTISDDSVAPVVQASENTVADGANGLSTTETTVEPGIDATTIDGLTSADAGETAITPLAPNGDLSQAGATLDSAAVTDENDAIVATSQVAPVVNANDVASDLGDGEVTAQINVNFVDEQGNAVADATTLSGTVGFAYDSTPALVSGYNLVMTPVNAKGVFGNDAKTITYVYAPIASTLTVKYVATDGTVLDQQVLTNGVVGDDYQTTAESFGLYSLAVTPVNYKGTLSAGENTVTYVYTANADVGLVNNNAGVNVTNLGVDATDDEVQDAKDAALADYLATGREQVITRTDAASNTDATKVSPTSTEMSTVRNHLVIQDLPNSSQPTVTTTVPGTHVTNDNGGLKVVFDNSNNLGTGQIKTHYKLVGTYNGRNVGVDMTISGIISKYTYKMTDLNENWNWKGISFSNNFFEGYNVSHANDWKVQLHFFYTDDNSAVDFSQNTTFVTINSLNGDEPEYSDVPDWIKPYGAVEYATRLNRGNDPYYVASDTALSDYTNPVTGSGTVTGGTTTTNDNFTDGLGNPKFTEGSVSFQLTKNDATFEVGSVMGLIWTTFSSATIWNVTPTTPTKTVDQKGKVILAGDTTTTHISQYTGSYANGSGSTYSNFYVGDAIVKTNQGTLPVTYDLSKWTVTTDTGANVTSQGKFVESDTVINNHAVRLVKWVPNNTSSIKDNTTYTLNTVFTSVNDHSADSEVDYPASFTGTPNIPVTLVEYSPTTDKNWVEGSQTVNNKTTINGDQITAQVSMTLPDPNTLINPLTKVQLVDDYTKFSSSVSYVGAKVLENGIDVTSAYTIANAGGKVTATRKIPASTPDGTVLLQTTFKVNANVSDATILYNNGSGTINLDTKPTPEVPIVTYTPDTDKNWVAGSQKVNNKTYIDGDTVVAQVNMTLPTPSSLATPLSNVQVTDNYSKFASLVDYQGAKVLENGIDVSGNYTIVNSAGVVTATRKTPASTPDGNIILQTTFTIHKGVATGTKLLNSGSGTLNTDKVPTPEVSITTYTPDPEKHWTEGSQSVDGKTYISGDTVHATVSMDLPDPATLAEPLSKVQVTDDYTKYFSLVDYNSAKVLENGVDATNQYTISVANGIVTATRKTASAAPGGSVDLVSTFTIHPDVKSGTVLTNAGTGTLNTATVPTNTPTIVTYVPSTSKHWVEGSQNVDNKTYIDSDTIHANVTMSLPDPASLGAKLTNVTLVDDYRKFQNLAKYQSAVVTENGTDVTSQYTITAANGYVTATRKTPSTTPGGSVTLTSAFKINADVPTGTTLLNDGSGTINKEKVPTPEVPIQTYRQVTDKHWVEGSQQVDNKTYINDDTVNAQVSMTLPDPKTLAAPLSKVQLIDNYSKFASLVDYKSVQVLENGVDVTSQYTITNAAGIVTATRKTPSVTPDGTAILKTTWTIHDNVPTGTKLLNDGSGTLNSETIPTPEVPVITYDPTTDKHWVEGSQSVDGKTYINDDLVHAQVTMSLPNPTTLAAKLTNVQLQDNYSKFANYVTYKSATVTENGVDVTSQYTLTNMNGVLTATRKTPGTTPGGSATLYVNWQIKDAVPTGTVLTNSGSGTLNKDNVPTPTPSIVTYTPDTDKHWTEGSQVVDNKTYINDDVANATITMSLPTPSTLANKLTNVTLVDDYTKFQNLVNYQGAKVLENGKDVTSSYNISIAKGLVTATRKDPGTTPGGSVAMTVSFKINDDVPSGTTLLNNGSGTLNTDKVPTPEVPIITFTPDTDKHWVAGKQVVDGQTYINDDVVTAQVSMTLPDPDKMATDLTNVQLTDDYTKFSSLVSFVGAVVIENGVDVTSLYALSNKKGILTATRKAPATTPGGSVVLKTQFKINDNVPSGTTLLNNGSGTLNTDTVPTPEVPVITFTPDTDKHWVEGSQIVDNKTYINDDTITAQVSMTLPQPSTLAEKLSNVQVTDDYSKFKNSVDYKGAQVLENGIDVTAQYTIANANGIVTATRKVPAATPAGTVILKTTFTIYNNVPSLTTLLNNGSGTLNSDKVPTPEVPITTYTPETDKHFVEGSQVVDNKAYINDDTITAQVSMTLPQPSTLATKLTKVQLVDDYTKYVTSVDYVGAKVLENGIDVTSQYTITNAKGYVTATRKDAGQAPSGATVLQVQFKLHDDVPSNSTLLNNGSGTINLDKVPTPEVPIHTYTPDTDKHWTEGSQIVDNKTYINDDTVNAQVSMSLPQPDTVAADLKKVELVDDYSKFKDSVDYLASQVFENEIDVTSQYTIKVANGVITATRKTPSATPGGSVVLKTQFKLHDDVTSGSTLLNNGSGTLNYDKVPTPEVPITTFTPDTDKHWVEGSQIVDNKTYINDDAVTTKISMTLPTPGNLATPLQKVQLIDDYSKFKGDVTYKSGHVFENGIDVSSQYTIVNADGYVTATRKSPATTPAGTAILQVQFTINDDVKSGTVLLNNGSGTLNYDKVPTPEVPIVTFTPDTDKHWTEGSQVVDNKTYINDDKVQATISMTLPDPDTLANPLSKVQLIDDYSKFQQDVDYEDAFVFENGQDVTKLYNITNINGVLTATRRDPASTPEGDVVIITSFTIHDDVPSGTVLLNNGSGTLNFDKVPTPEVPITTYTPDTDKNWVAGDQVVNNKVVINDDTVSANITMTLPDPSKLAADLNNVVLTDDWSKFKGLADYVGAVVTENGYDVSAKYRIVNKNGLVTAMRIDPASTPGGIVSMTTSFKLHDDISSGTTLFNNGSGTLNFDKVPTPEVPIKTYTPDTDKHWVAGSQIVDNKIFINDDNVTAQVSMTLPDPTTLAEKLTNVQLTDDYTKFVNQATYVGATVLENDQDVTSLYTITVKDGYVTATRKDASTAPGGLAVLTTIFKINDDVPSGSTLLNNGAGTINLDKVPTPETPIKTYTPDTDKHWVEGSQIVDNKTYINDDAIHANVTMSLPNPSELGKALTKVQVTDDYTKFKDLVDYQSATIFENGQDVTALYTVTAKDGYVTATRKDASKAPGGIVSLVANFVIHDDVPSGTVMLNNGSGTINADKVPTPEVPIKTYTPDTDKHWVAGDQVVDGMTYVNDDQVTANVSMTLPDPDDLATKLTNVQVTDDFSKFAELVDYLNSTITENGVNANDLYEFTVGDGYVIATRKDAGSTPAGTVVLTSNFKIHDDVPSGTELLNNGSGTINSDEVPTPEVPVTTYTPDTDKHWVAGDQIVDNKTVVNDDTINAQVSMSLPDPTKLAEKLTNVVLTDDYTDFFDLVDYAGATVWENGKDVTSLYNITNDAKGYVIAVRKDAGSTPAGTAVLKTAFTLHDDVPTGSKLINSGSGTLNYDTVPTPDVPVTTYEPEPDKHWTLDGSVTDNKVYLSGDNPVAEVSVTLPDAKDLATPLTNVTLDDDYSDFATSVDVSDVKVMENTTDATALYTVTVKDGHIIAVRKDASTTPSGTAKLVTTFVIHDDVADGTILTNKGSVTINTDNEPVPDTPIVTWQPQPDKDVELGTVTGDTNNSIDGETVAKGSVLTYPLTSDNGSVPANRADEITERKYVDTLQDGTKYYDFSAWVMDSNGKLTDVTDHIKTTVVGQTVTFMEDSYLLARYNTDKSVAVTTPIIDLRVTTDQDNKTMTNSYKLYTNGHEDTSKTVTITTPDPTPTKVELNDQGVNIDGKNVLSGSVNDYQLTWDLSQYKDVNATKESIADGFYFIEDYPEAALAVNLADIQMMANGQAVTGVSKTAYASLAAASDSVKAVIAKAGITEPDGAFIWFSADDPQTFFTNYVEPGYDITINAPMTVKSAFTGSFTNIAYEIDFGNGYTTNPVVNNVPKIDVSKDIVLSLDDTDSLNNGEIDLNQNFDYKLTGGVLPANEGDAISEYGWHDDYDQTKDQYNGQYTALLSVAVTLKDGTVLAKGTDISKYVTEVVDQVNGKIDAEIDASFLATVDFDKSEFGADLYIAMTRIATGEVTNVYVNTINDQTYTSNTVTSHTPEPEKPVTPETPETPAVPTTPTATPEEPVTPTPEQPEVPATPVAETPATPKVTPVAAVKATPKAMAKATPAVKAATLPTSKTSLPQTGEKNEDGLAELGLLLAAAAGTLGLFKLKRKDDDEA